VGVVPSIKYADLSQSESSLAVYFNLDQAPSRDMYLMIHTALPPTASIKPMQRLLAAAAPNVAINRIHTMHEQLADSLHDKQTTMTFDCDYGAMTEKRIIQSLLQSETGFSISGWHCL
jgi:hypothetical protein